MKIAVTYEDGMVFQHFGHTQQFKLYEVENGAVQNEQVVDTQGSGHGALAGFLTQYDVDTLLCGGIGGGAQNRLQRRAYSFMVVFQEMRTRLSVRFWRGHSPITRMYTAAIMNMDMTAVRTPAARKRI